MQPSLFLVKNEPVGFWKGHLVIDALMALLEVPDLLWLVNALCHLFLWFSVPRLSFLKLSTVRTSNLANLKFTIRPMMFIYITDIFSYISWNDIWAHGFLHSNKSGSGAVFNNVPGPSQLCVALSCVTWPNFSFALHAVSYPSSC